MNALRVALRINSGKNIYNFGIAERLRALRYPIFTGGVVEGNGICSAASYGSAALREAFSPSPSVRFAHCHLSQRERPWQKDKLCVDCQGLPLWGSWRVSA